MLMRIWDLILRIVRLRASVNFQFVFSHCGVPHNEAADKAAEQGNAKPQSYPAWITVIVTGVERQVRNEMYRAFEEGRMPRMHRSALLDHGRPAPKHSKVDRLGELLLAQFRKGSSKHFGLLHRVLTSKTDQLECRWCSLQVAVSDAEEERPLAETMADTASAPDPGITTRQVDPIICPLCNMVRARRRAGVVHLEKIRGLERDCALALTKKARRAALTHENGYACRVCGEDFERLGLLVEHMATHPPDVVPTVEERPKRAREEDSADDGNALKCPWCACAKKYTAHRGSGSTCYRRGRKGSYQEDTQSIRKQLVAMARQTRRNMRRRNFYATSAIASSRARRGSPGTSANQPLSQARKTLTWRSSQ
ncbi:hypothetical protein ERJ75_000367900 [Trypanosoma vivax]|nr:hypothetical protein ERJ75_000367900 [Trypanosoma vivax]